MYEFYEKWVRVFVPRLMADFNVSHLDACAVFGNAGQESNGFQSLQEMKPLVPGSKGGYGIMQWTGPRRRDYEEYCARNKLDPADMESNYKFLFVELKGPEGKVLPKLKAAEGLEKKTEVFMSVFLRPGIPHLDSRIAWARRCFAMTLDYDMPAQPSPPLAPHTPSPESSNTGLMSIGAIVAALIGAIIKYMGG